MTSSATSETSRHNTAATSASASPQTVESNSNKQRIAHDHPAGQHRDKARDDRQGDHRDQQRQIGDRMDRRRRRSRAASPTCSSPARSSTATDANQPLARSRVVI